MSIQELTFEIQQGHDASSNLRLLRDMIEDYPTSEELAKMIQQHKDVQSNLEKLYLRNLWIIVGMARRYVSGDYQELMQVGYMGLASAAERYKENQGANFATYAHYWINCEMLRHLNSEQTMVSLNELVPIGDKPVELIDTIADDTDYIEDIINDVANEELKQVLWDTVDELNEKQALVLREYYGQGKTLTSIAAEQGTSVQTIQQRSEQGIKCIRKKKSRMEKLREYYNDIYGSGITGTSLSAYRKNGTSATERTAIELATGYFSARWKVKR